MTVKVTFAPAAPKPGDTVTFHVVVDDADGGQLLEHPDNTNDYGDGTPSNGIAGHIDCVGGWGPWTPPDPVPVHQDVSYKHVYTGAGTYAASFTFQSLGDCAHPPDKVTTTVSVPVGG
jgi:hypothetical protein